MTSRTVAKPVQNRLQWLDIARVLFALMVLGIHWLRAGYYVGLFGSHDPVNLVIDYQGQSGGMRLFHYVLIAGTGPTLQTWLTNAIGILGGFGWEAVSALILVSGFSLAIAQRDQKPIRAGWWSWFKRRAARILVPFYLVAAGFLTLYAFAITILPHYVHDHVLARIAEAKLLAIFQTPPIGVVISQIFLFDPYGYQWGPEFFAPAWWFVPAILLAYAVYPLLWRLSGFRHGLPLLAGAAAVTIVSYILSDVRVLVNESWYYIVLQELFTFSLGIVVGRMWMENGRRSLEGLLDDPRGFCIAFLVFVLGNIANWTPSARPVASMLYGPALVLMIVFLARRVEKHRAAVVFSKIDPYSLYLVHQPFAFPTALLAGWAFRGYATFVGWWIFVAVAVLAAILLSVCERRFFDSLRVPQPVAARGRVGQLHAKRRAS